MLFKPQAPIVESKWDGVTFETLFLRNRTNSTTGVNSALHTVRDIWLDPASNPSIFVDGLPNVQGLGGKFINDHVDTNGSDWTLLKDYSWVYYNATTKLSEFQACVDRRFRTESAQDWQLSNAFMQNFAAFGYFSGYNTNTFSTDFETRGSLTGASPTLLTI